MIEATGNARSRDVDIGEGYCGPRRVRKFAHDVLKLWIEKKNDYPSFAAYVDEKGTEEIQEIAGRQRKIPVFGKDSSCYQDWGASESFSPVGRGIGECSAGLFDLIEVDLNAARQLRE
jgi:sulfite reductase (ferredoxin)